MSKFQAQALISAGSLLAVALVASGPARSQQPQLTALLFENVRVFDGTSDRLSAR